MNEVENQAQELLRHKEWASALGLFDQLLGYAAVKGLSRERVVGYLLGRSECCLELGRHEAVVSDCKKIIKLLGGIESGNNCAARARRRLVHALFTLRRYAEAEAAAAEWIASSGGMTSTNPEAVKMLERVRIGLQMANGQKNVNVKAIAPAPQHPRVDDEILAIDYRLESLFNPALDDRPRRNRKHPVELLGECTGVEPSLQNSDFQQTILNFGHMSVELNNVHIVDPLKMNCLQPQIDHMAAMRISEEMKGPVIQQNQTQQHQQQMQLQQQQAQQMASRNGFSCTYCCLTFPDRNDLRAHCQTESHQRVIMSDEGRDWKWRPPPRGFTSENYSLCEWWADSSVCRYGAQCVEAHGPQELQEWRERFEYRRMKLQRASEKELYGKSYTEQLLERWLQAASPDRVMRERVEGVEECCSGDLVTTVSSKISHRDWTFTLRTVFPLRAVALLQDAHRNHFFLKLVMSNGVQSGKPLVNCEVNNGQEWTYSGEDQGEVGETLEHTIKVGFSTEIYGTFRQSLVFDVGNEPVLVKHLCVDVIPVTDADKIREIKKELVLSAAERWDKDNVQIVSFSSPVVPVTTLDIDREKELLAAYPMPRADTFALTQSTISEKKLTRNNYRARMHELLCVEEMARYEQVARYNLSARLKLANCYLLSPSGVAASTAKYAHNGELFALMALGKDVSEDTSAGRLILNNCTTVLLSPTKADKLEIQLDAEKNTGEERPKRMVYEALIEDKGKNVIYLRLSAATVSMLELKNDTEFAMEVQFQLNRVPYCEWHHAIDKIADFRVIFPETLMEPSIPWTPQRKEKEVKSNFIALDEFLPGSRQWSGTLDAKLNLKQKEAVVAITTPVASPLPPILIIGPFGTGKTYTLAQAIKEVLLQPNTRVLVCTHSNSAADLYIKDYLHPYVESGHEEARPLRIYYHKRWVATVNQVVQKYCLIENNNGVRTFKVATLQDIMNHRVIVVTLSISMNLSSIGLNKGHFSHILLDEAAQAMECEAIMPLALANEDTRIVLAGDHMQLSPELFSQFAKERHLHVSLLERLYDHYPPNFTCKILLCENYRAHEAIIQFTSELFYDQKLISSGKQPRHDKFYPLTFFTTRGEDVQDHNSTAFYNNSEVYEVVERVCELKKRWPSSWGKLDEHSIGIMTPYADQVFRIRSELRKRRMGGISVERVLNVQGKQFRAIFLSTVRTRRTCESNNKARVGDEMDYGFLSNSKLLNTAITRAQSLVAVVGDPVALCSIGRCRKVWERFIEICNSNNSLHGIKWSYLRSLLDGVELKKTYTLNPLAPEFIPRQFQAETYIRLPSIMGTYNGIAPGMRFVTPYLPPAPIYPVPAAAYFPSYQPPPTSFYPLRPPTTSVYPPTSAPQLNPWGVNYPQMISPSNTNGVFPTNTWLKKKQELSPPLRREEIRPPPGLLPPQQRPPFSQLPRPSPPSPNQAVENFISQNSFLRPAEPPSPFVSPPIHTQVQSKPPQVLDQQRRIIQPQNSFDKEHIQFLHNVHFPERQQGVPLNGLTVSNLLPADVSLSELAESQQKQLDWYTHLLDTMGLEAAIKFSELMAMVPRKPTPLISEIRSADDMFSEKFNGHQMQNGHLPQTQALESPVSQSQRPHTWYLSETVHKEPAQQQQTLPVIDCNPAAALHHQQQQVAMQDLKQMQQQQQQLVTQRILAAERFDLGGNWDGGVTTSVPLYRRQPQSQIQDSNVHSLIEDSKPVNGTSGAFAGYARAAISLQSRDTNLYNDDSGDELLANIQRTTTYASVVRTQGKSDSNSPVEEKGDPFAVLRGLGSKSTTSGLYHYFS